jgi:hypothetical protein
MTTRRLIGTTTMLITTVSLIVMSGSMVGDLGRSEVPDLSAMVAFEEGELDEDGVIALFQELVNSGLAFRLQGFYGRTAMALIEAGLIEAPK